MPLMQTFLQKTSETVPKLAANTEEFLIDFKSYIQKYDSVQSKRDLSVNRLKETTFCSNQI